MDVTAPGLLLGASVAVVGLSWWVWGLSCRCLVGAMCDQDGYCVVVEGCFLFPTFLPEEFHSRTENSRHGWWQKGQCHQ